MFENILLPSTKRLLEKLSPASLPNDSYLAGGTAIALHLGHRRSADLDFFTPSNFNESVWEEKLKKELGFKLIQRDWQTLTGSVGQVKLSLFGYNHKLINKTVKLYNTQVASPPDLAAIKLNTIIGRGTKRDLIDIYFLAQEYTLGTLFKFYQQKYADFQEKEIMIKKALVFFEEADKDEMPNMLAKTEWGSDDN